MTSTYTSKHFEQSVSLLRDEVSRYIERGICILDNGLMPSTVLQSTNIVFSVCKEVAKARNVPFVHLLYYDRGSAAGKIARVSIPGTVKARPLTSQARLIGRPFSRNSYTAYPVSVDIKKSNAVDAYYCGTKGMEALQSWLTACAEDNGMRYALGLPPKVRRDPAT